MYRLNNVGILEEAPHLSPRLATYTNTVDPVSATLQVIVITQEMVQHGLCCPRVGCCHEGTARVTTSARGQLTHVASFLG